MKKNLVAIETAAILVLIGLIIAGIILKIFTLIIIPICLLIIGILGIAIYKIIELKRDNDAKSNTNTAHDKDGKASNFSNPKNAWEFSTIGEKTKSIAFIFTFTVCCIAFLILCMYGHIKAGIITIIVGIVLIVLAIITMAVIEKYLIKKHKENKNNYSSNSELVETTEESNEPLNIVSTAPISQEQNKDLALQIEDNADQQPSDTDI